MSLIRSPTPSSSPHLLSPSSAITRILLAAKFRSGNSRRYNYLRYRLTFPPAMRGRIEILLKELESLASLFTRITQSSSIGKCGRSLQKLITPSLMHAIA